MNQTILNGGCNGSVEVLLEPRKEKLRKAMARIGKDWLVPTLLHLVAIIMDAKRSVEDRLVAIVHLATMIDEYGPALSCDDIMPVFVGLSGVSTTTSDELLRQTAAMYFWSLVESWGKRIDAASAQRREAQQFAAGLHAAGFREKIRAIKLIRDRFRIGIKDSKEVAESAGF